MVIVLAKKGEELHTLYLNEITEEKDFINFSEGNQKAETLAVDKFKVKYDVLGKMVEVKDKDIAGLKR